VSFNTFLPRRIRFYRTLPETGCMYLDEVWWGRWSTRRRRLREWLDSCDTWDVQTLVVDTASASVNDRPTSVLGGPLQRTSVSTCTCKVAAGQASTLSNNDLNHTC